MGIIELHHIFLLRNHTFMRILRSNHWILAETRFPKATINPETNLPRRSWVIFQVKPTPVSGTAENYIPPHETVDWESLIELNLESDQLIPSPVLQQFYTASRQEPLRPLHPAEQCALLFLERELKTGPKKHLSQVA